MKYRIFGYILTILVLALIFSQYLLIPALSNDLYLSPDETAVRATAERFAKSWEMGMADDLLGKNPWLHPRSFVTFESRIVPVGFLGMPAILGILAKLFGSLIFIFFTPILVITCLYPLWKMSKNFGLLGQMAVIFTWLSFPTVILYANRGLFPNLPLVCLTIWSLYLLTGNRLLWKLALSGFLFGLALTIRPIEIFWILPWIILFWIKPLNRTPQQRLISWKKIAVYTIFFAIPIAAAFLLAYKTYDSPFTIGYWLRDPELGKQIINQTANRSWPFGFHPMHVWFNFKNYYVYFLGPWLAISLASLLIHFKDKQNRLMFIQNRLMFIAIFWTFFSLLLVYGQAVYQDHVGLNVPSFGNSFLRYTLPLAPIFAFAAGSMISFLSKKTNVVRSHRLGFLVIGFLVLIGFWMALIKDDEGLVQSRVEIYKYWQIKKVASEMIDEKSIIISDRSDKIFFPSFRVASPMPSKDKVVEFTNSSESLGIKVYLFSEILSEKQINEWNTNNFIPELVFQIQNQALYWLRPVIMSEAL